ncbi:hypothetical protein ILUMI_09998 [Ignelater luminosus]|uniref:CCDC113/CCDC96 coiled-coil domain-containing protein n=1 Tax=Ignelater luminosus TaxID=2038154 RepID=A0A8K0G942_IGNLU|nr:hypothetical protein ILUMI_09998 [Ignelater luminosus]
MADRQTIDSDDEIPPIVDTEINPEGYGIEGEFEPVAVFDVIDQPSPPTEDNVFETGPDETVGEEQEEGEEEGEEGESEGEMEEEGEVTEGEGEEMEGEEKAKTEEGEEEEEKKSAKEQPEEEGKEAVTEEEKVSTKGEEEEEEGQEEGQKEEEKKELKFEAEEEDKTAKKLFKKDVKRRMSIRKKSIFYPDQARLRTIDERRVSGDFAVIEEGLLGTLGSPPSILSFEPESGEYAYEEEIVEEEEAPPIDRNYYYNIYKTLVPEQVLQRMKNNFLHRKMAEYFRKRKMEHVLKETDQQVDSQQKYDRKLDALSDLKDLDTRERNSISAELNDMRSQRDDQLSMLNIHFNTMQNREKEIGTGLINTKTGKEIPDKLVERLLKRQRDKWTEVASMRLAYIKIRDRVGEKKAALHALDCIGDNLHLIDYEQLKIENQSHTDKIEERDEELTRLRVKCQGAMQCLAHVREKSAAIQIDIQSLTERYEEVAMEYSECRERLNYFKQERDNYRIETDKLCEESGLLSKPKLLLDMEKALKEVDIKSKQLENLQEENQRIKYSLNAVKRNIKLAPAKIQTVKEAPTSKTVTSRIYRGRPTLIYPQLPKSDWSGSTDL